MQSTIKLYCLLAGFWAMAGVLTGEVYRVAMPSAGGDDGNAGLDWTAPKASISNALAQGDVTDIWVSNGTYNLVDVVNISKAVIIRSWNNGSVDRDGTIMVGAGTNRCFLISHAGAIVDGFTITNGFCQDGVPQKGDSDYYTSGRGGGVFITHAGGLLTNCLVIGNAVQAGASYKGGGGVYLFGGAAWNCRITGNMVTNDAASSSMGGGVGVFLYGTSDYPTGMVVNCEIDNNKVYRNPNYAGGGIGVFRAGLINNCDIYSNYSSGRGGGVFAQEAGIITNCRIISNTSESDGAGVCLFTNSNSEAVSILLHACLISNNVAGYPPPSGTYGIGSGGGVAVTYSTNHVIRDCDIVNNTCGRDGGGVYMTVGGRIENCVIADNVSHGINYGGGGICAIPAETNLLFIGNVMIAGNTAAAPGGGAILRNVWMDNSTIMDNKTLQSGGGIFAFATSTVVNCQIFSNRADTTGGGINVGSGGIYGPGAVVIRNCLIAGNSGSNRFGGGVYLQNNASGEINCCTVVDNEVQGNQSQQRGAGICVAYTNRIYNCLVWSNRWSGTANDAERDMGMYQWGNLEAQSNSVHYCISPRDFSGVRGNITNAPSFIDFNGGDFRLAAQSPGINAGTNMPWMFEPGAGDLDGRPRRDRFSRQADMGCYEYLPGGVMFSVR